MKNEILKKYNSLNMFDFAKWLDQQFSMELLSIEANGLKVGKSLKDAIFIAF